MSNNQSSAQTYVLGHAPEEIQRLLKQAQFLNPFTRRLLEDAGLRAGMKVLDVGCGPGDVSLIAAELVGEEGLVIGVDTNASVLDIAQVRAQAACLRQVSFLARDIGDLALEQEFDAIVGRLILQHVREPASLLRLLAQRLHPGGLLAFQEHDLTDPSEWIFPPSPLWEQAATWCKQAGQRVGVERRMGTKLYGTFLSAGLPAPQLRYEAAIGAGPVGADIAEVLAWMVRALLPLILQFEIATAEEIGVETLTERLREEILSRGGSHEWPVSSLLGHTRVRREGVERPGDDDRSLAGAERRSSKRLNPAGEQHTVCTSEMTSHMAQGAVLLNSKAERQAVFVMRDAVGSCASSLMVDIIPTGANVSSCFVSRSALSILSDLFLESANLRKSQPFWQSRGRTRTLAKIAHSTLSFSIVLETGRENGQNLLAEVKLAPEQPIHDA